MFAVIQTGGKQFTVCAGHVLTTMFLPGEPGTFISFNHILMIGDGQTSQFGTPFIEGAEVMAEILQQKRGPKVIAFKKRRRKNSKRKRGHRQDLTQLRIVGLTLQGQSVPFEPAANKA